MRRESVDAIASDDLVLDFPKPIPPLRHVRSTLVLGGLASISEAGLFDAYTELAPEEVRVAIQSSVAGMWLPVATVVAHYLACDRLGISSESAAQLGRRTFERMKGTLLGPAMSMAKGAGVTPWTLIPYFQRFWLRGNDGGGIRAVRLGPKEARIDIVSCPHFVSRYFRSACRGLGKGLLELVCQKAYIHDQPFGEDETARSFRVQWV